MRVASRLINSGQEIEQLRNEEEQIVFVASSLFFVTREKGEK